MSEPANVCPEFDKPIGKVTTTLDYLRVRHEWLGVMIDETAARVAALEAENARLHDENARLRAANEKLMAACDRAMGMALPQAAFVVLMEATEKASVGEG